MSVGLVELKLSTGALLIRNGSFSDVDLTMLSVAGIQQQNPGLSVPTEGNEELVRLFYAALSFALFSLVFAAGLEIWDRDNSDDSSPRSKFAGRRSRLYAGVVSSVALAILYILMAHSVPNWISSTEWRYSIRWPVMAVIGWLNIHELLIALLDKPDEPINATPFNSEHSALIGSAAAARVMGTKDLDASFSNALLMFWLLAYAGMWASDYIVDLNNQVQFYALGASAAAALGFVIYSARVFVSRNMKSAIFIPLLVIIANLTVQCLVVRENVSISAQHIAFGVVDISLAFGCWMYQAVVVMMRWL